MSRRGIGQFQQHHEGILNASVHIWACLLMYRQCCLTALHDVFACVHHFLACLLAVGQMKNDMYMHMHMHICPTVFLSAMHDCCGFARGASLAIGQGF